MHEPLPKRKNEKDRTPRIRIGPIFIMGGFDGVKSMLKSADSHEFESLVENSESSNTHEVMAPMSRPLGVFVFFVVCQLWLACSYIIMHFQSH